MSAQLALALTAPARPLARRTDQIGSHEAAEAARARIDTECAEVLAALHQHPNTTSRELAARSGLDRYLVARRLPELEERGQVKAKVFHQDLQRLDREVDTTMAPCAESKRLVHAIRWVAVQASAGRNAA